MALVDTISIEQDNNIGGANLLACHNLVAYIVDVVWFTVPTPESVVCEITIGGETLQLFKLMPYQQVSDTNIKYIFFADSILRAYLPDFSEYDLSQSTGDVIAVLISKEATLTFYYEEEPEGETVAITQQFANAVRQFGEGCNMLEEYNNERRTMTGYKGIPFYSYAFINNTAIGDDVTIIVEPVSDFEIEAYYCLNESSYDTINIEKYNPESIVENEENYIEFVGTDSTGYCEISKGASYASDATGLEIQSVGLLRTSIVGLEVRVSLDVIANDDDMVIDCWCGVTLQDWDDIGAITRTTTFIAESDNIRIQVLGEGLCQISNFKVEVNG